MLEQMRAEIRAKESGIQTASAADMEKIDQLAKGGKLPPGIVPGQK